MRETGALCVCVCVCVCMCGIQRKAIHNIMKGEKNLKSSCISNQGLLNFSRILLLLLTELPTHLGIGAESSIIHMYTV